MEKENWVYVDYKKGHSHDVRALTVAVPISQEGLFESSVIFLFLCSTLKVVLMNVCLEGLVCKISLSSVFERVF